MTKQVFSALAILTTTSISSAAPVVIGDVEFKQELVVLNKNVVCSAYGAPTNNVKQETLVYGTFTAAVAQEDGSILVTGHLDGDLFQISGQPSESLHFSLQEASKAGSLPAYSSSSSGSFTNEVIHGKVVRVAGLDMMINGKTKHIGCSLK